MDDTRLSWLLFTVLFCIQLHCIPAQTDKKPAKESWITGDRTRLLEWLIGQPDAKHKYAEQNGLDGFANNPFQPELGAFDTSLLRRSPAQYSDGVFRPSGQGRPNPITISETLMKSSQSPGTTSKTGKTAALVFFGQQLVEEVLDAQKPHCPPEYFNIPIPEDHHYRNETGLDSLPLLRTRYDAATGSGPNNPRQQLNEVTPYLDGNLVYGTSPTWADTLRHFANGSLAPRGQLAWSHDGRFPEFNNVSLPMFNPPPPSLHSKFKEDLQLLPTSRHFMLGNPRGNENPMLLSFGILWFRWHNYIAKYLDRKHGQSWSDDRIFNEAKKWVIATYQHIAIDEWLPSWIGEKLPPYKGYDSSINPQIDQLFQTAAMRFGHTLVLSGVYLRDYSRNGCRPIPVTIVRDPSNPSMHGSAVRTCNSFWRPQDIILNETRSTDGTVSHVDIDRLIMGMASQLSEREDSMIVEDLRGKVFGLMEFPRRDLMAINIQRARDHGAPDYNTARRSMGLDPIRDFKTFISQTGTTVHVHDPGVIDRFTQLYSNATIDNVDLWVGGLLETAFGPGQLFRAVLKDQFSRIRSADRFWYANLENKLFTREEVRRLEQLTLYDVIMAVTRMEIGDLQENPFLSPSEDVPGQKLSSTCMARMVQVTNCTAFGPFVNQTQGDFRCQALPQTGTAQAPIEPCTPPSSFWYFSGSEVSFPVTVSIECLVIAVTTVVLITLLGWNIRNKEDVNKQIWKSHVKRSIRSHPEHYSEFTGMEWVGKKDEMRLVNVLFNSITKVVEVRDESTKLLRTINLSRGQPFDLWLSSNGLVAVLKLPKEYDLVIKCEGTAQRKRFVDIWRAFVEKAGIGEQQRARNPDNQMSEKNLLESSVTVRMRRKRLQKFFRSVFSQAFSKPGQQVLCRYEGTSSVEVMLTELSKEEFANELRMMPESPFVEKMFELVDKDKNGFISFHEFLDLLVIFTQGTVDDKLKLIFSIYDVHRTGYMTLPEFNIMIKSLIDLSNADIAPAHITTTVQGMVSSMKLQRPGIVTLTEFQQLMKKHRNTLAGMQMAFTGPDVPVEFRNAASSSRYHQTRKTVMSIYFDPDKPPTSNETSNGSHRDALEVDESTERSSKKSFVVSPDSSKESSSWIATWSHQLDYWRLETCWMTLFTLFLWAVFAERAYTYGVEREHVGFRQATGWGVAITRGAASGMMFAFSFVLLSSCRHVATVLRAIPSVYHYVPLDSLMTFHQYAACWGIFFAVVHTVGHGFNFYYLTTQPASDLTCLFREHFHASHILPKYHHWVYGTSTGITGILLWIQTVVVFFFSLPFVRRRLYGAFWITHNLYPVFYALLLLHGAARLVQEPHFPYYLIGPVIVFAINLLMSLSRRRVQVSIVDAQLLPSDVTKLVIKKPTDFSYHSGQWIRIACPALGDEVYHPFTLSSAPQEPEISLHIRAVGPWTKRLRETIQRAIHLQSPLPKVLMDGPYGGGHQEWRRYPVSILIAGGIGVTPFASILKDIAARLSTKASSLDCQKIYFLWITRDQKQFEWMVDLLRHVEAKDTNGLVSSHVFITQFSSKFDIRTVMLYVCERYFQKIERRSLFTGLRSVTHFGQPNFPSILANVGSVHSDVGKIGVFSCGPRPMTRSVDAACHSINKLGTVDFRHHYDIF